MRTVPPNVVEFCRGIYERVGLSLATSYTSVPRRLVTEAAVANESLFQAVSHGGPLMVGRLGVSEADVLLNYLEKNDLKRLRGFQLWHQVFKGKRAEWDSKAVDLLRRNAGFFPTDDFHLDRFAADFLEDLRAIDRMATWKFVPGEALLADLCCPSAELLRPSALEPYYFQKPWSEALRGKTVLVIHPFVSSIQAQYKKRQLLFCNPHILPAFHLVTIRAVQSLGGNSVDFTSWFEARDRMKEEIDKVEYDVALIGAGAYGVPLAAHIKKRGKVALQLGGALQILFGIKGRRWDQMPRINRLYNKHWVRPCGSEQVPYAEKIEGGCYW